MSKKSLLSLAGVFAVLLCFLPDAYNNSAQAPIGHTGAPSEATCATTGCHTGPSPISNAQFILGFAGGTPTTYTTSQQYNMFTNLSASAPVRGFQITAVDDAGNRIGNFSLVNASLTTLDSAGVGGKQYVSHNQATGAGAWAFRWTAPATYSGTAYFYATGLAADGNNDAANDLTYFLVDSLPPLQSGGSVTADFTATTDTICVTDGITFTDQSSGNITTYQWNFGTDATPGTAGTAGPHNVQYSSAGNKLIELVVSDGSTSSTVTETLTVVPEAVADAGPDETICAGQSVTLTASGGLNYEWSTNATSQSITVSPVLDTEFYVTVTSAGCSDVDTVTVFVSSTGVAVDAGNDTTVCVGESVTLTATGADTYEWSTTDVTASITETFPATGTYTYTVEGTETASGCTGTDTVVVTVVDAPNLTLADTFLCPGGVVVLDAGSFPGADYTWSNGDLTQTTSVSALGTYYVTVTIGSCTAVDSSTVALPDFPPLDAGPDQTICAGEVVLIGNPDSVPTSALQPILLEQFNSCTQPTGWTTMPTSGTNSWSFGNDLDRTPSNMNGSCMAYFNDDFFGSSAVGGAYLESPSVDVTSFGAVFLQVDYIFRELSTPPDFFAVDVYDGATWQTVRNFTSTVSSGGTAYSNFITDTIDLSAFISADLRVRFLYDDGGGFAWYAGVDNFALFGLPNNLYSWTPTTGIASPTSPVTLAAPTVTTNYILTATVSGCTISDTVVVNVNPAPTVTLTGLAANYCDGDTNGVQLTGTPAGGTYAGPGLTDSTFRAADAGVGTHDILYTYFDPSLGCDATDTVTVTVNALPTPSIDGLDAVVCADAGLITLTGTPAGGTFSGAGIVGGSFDPSVAGAGTSTVTYVVTNAAGCTDSISQDVDVVSAVASFTGLGTGYCAQTPTSDTLSGLPIGGTFSGPGMTDSVFDAALAGPGIHDIVYTYDTFLAYNMDVNCVFDTVPGAGTGTTFNYSSSDDAVSGQLPIGFTFYFFGQPYTQFVSSTNGWISFDNPTNSYFSNDDIPTSSGTNNFIAYMWDDLTSSSFEYYVVGTAPNRQLVLNFYNSAHLGDLEPVQAQVVLYETSNVIEIHCIACTADASGPSATQGIENAAGTVGYAPTGRNDDDWSAFDDCVRFTPLVCSASDIQTVTVEGAYIANNDTAVCAGEQVTLTAAGGTGYTWSTGQTGNTITVTATMDTAISVTGSSAGGCLGTDTVFITVNPSPTVTLTGLASNYCSNEDPVSLTVSPAGGTLSGPGISGTTFDPGASGVPTGGTSFDITYVVTNAFGCTDSVEVPVTVELTPAASIDAIPLEYCLDDAPVTLSATPAGGTFYGTGVSGGVFVPYYAGVGTHDIIYAAAVSANCVAYDTITVEVYDVPAVSFDPIAAAYCENDAPVSLNATPAGGTFSGPGVSGNEFDPAAAGVGGPYLLFYNYTDANGCSNTAVILTEVVGIPQLNWVGLSNNYCENDDPVVLNASPAGGSFSGTGVNGPTFDPTVAGEGQHTLTYTYTNGGCTNTLTLDVTVSPAPTVVLSGVSDTYCANDAVDELIGTPAGGVFAGIGVTGNYFSPSTAGAGGPYTISYTFEDANGCAATQSQDVTVFPFANTVIQGLEPQYCASVAEAISLQGFPVGGTLSGAGISGNTFNPNEAGVGTHTIIYEYVNGPDCISFSEIVVEVINCVGIAEAGSLGDVSVYPNPTTGKLYISFNGLEAEQVNLSIFNTQGQEIYNETIDQLTTAKELDLTNRSKGIYLVKMEADGRSFVTRVIVQ